MFEPSTEEELQEILDDTMSEILNTAIGNSTSDLEAKNIMVNFDPPTMFFGEKSYVKYAGNKVVYTEFELKVGKMIFAILS